MTLAFALHTLAVAPPSAHRAALGGAILFLAAAFGEMWALPLSDGNKMTLSAVALICAAVLYGASVTAVIAAAAFLAAAAIRREHPLKVSFNASMYALMGGAAGLAAHGRGGVIGAVLLAAVALVLVNVISMTLMATHTDVREAARSSWDMLSRRLILPIGLSLSVAPLFIIGWKAHPAIALIAMVPAVAIGMHLRAAEGERKATALSLTDPLTGLGNRRALASRIERELDRADGTGVPVSVCMLDLDAFKEINDAYGHAAGDRALVLVADVLRRDGEAFRYGGDEFVLVLPGRDREEAAVVGAAVRERVSALDAEEMPLAVTVGIATYPDGEVSRAEILRIADEALYAHKRVSG